MAAAYAYHIAENQPFVDGNKRTGLAPAVVFLALIDVEIEDPKGRLYKAMMDIAARKLSKKGLAALLSSMREIVAMERPGITLKLTRDGADVTTDQPCYLT